MKDSDNPYLIQGKKTKKDQGPKKKMFGYRVLGFGGGSLPDEYIAATGGTVSTVDTNFKVHVFNSPGTFCLSAGRGDLAKVDYLVVAGGGGGSMPLGGGGGGGGYRESHNATVSGTYTASPLATCVSLPIESPVPVTVGAGGPAGTLNPTTGNYVPTTASGPSVFSTITSAGGGGNPGCGGSGNGGGRTTNSGGSGNVPPVSPPQGNNGGGNAGGNSNDNAGGGGGGAGAAGQQVPSTQPYTSMSGGDGGAGSPTNITGSNVTRAGGGGGGTRSSGGVQPNNNQAPGGSGGGGAGGYTTGPGGGPKVVVATSGTANTGGGGGSPVYVGDNPPGPFQNDPTVDRENPSGAGGSGVVIIRYRFQA
jgi:hypothetical protein